MRKTPPTILLVICLSWVSPSGAQDKVQPCQDAFSDPSSARHELIRQALLHGPALSTSKPVARAVALPSSGPEWVVSVYIEQETAAIELRSMKQALGFESPGHSGQPVDEELSPDPEVIQARAAINRELALAIGQVWESELTDLASPEPSWLSDGISYHLSAWVQWKGTLCGRTTSSPDQGNVTGQIAELLREVVETPAAGRQEVEAKIWRLLDEQSSHCDRASAR